MGSAENDVALGWTVDSKVLPGLSVCCEIYQRDLKAVLESLALVTNRALALEEIPVEQLLRDSNIILGMRVT